MWTNCFLCGSSSTALSHISRVLYLSTLNFNTTVSLSKAWINIYLYTRDNFEAVASRKNSSFFIHNLQPPISIGTWKSESTDCEQPLLVPGTFLTFCISPMIYYRTYCGSINTRYVNASLLSHFHSPHFWNFVRG